MTNLISPILKKLLNNSSTVCIPQGYDKAYPEESIHSADFVANTYFKLLAAFANAQDSFETAQALGDMVLHRPYNPRYADSLLLNALKNVLGLNFILEELSNNQLRQVLYAKLLANVNDGSIAKTIAVCQALMQADFVQRIRLGGVNISYCAIGGSLPISSSELQTFWEGAHTGGIFIELRAGPTDFFGFAEDPFALGFSSIDSGPIVQAPNPYFGFSDDPNSLGFATIAAPTIGGYMPVLVQASYGGGSLITIIYD